MTREEKLNSLFRRAESVFRKRFPEGISLEAKDDLTAICVAHLSNYLPEVIPEVRPQLARIVSAILDLEIKWEEENARQRIDTEVRGDGKTR